MSNATSPTNYQRGQAPPEPRHGCEHRHLFGGSLGLLGGYTTAFWWAAGIFVLGLLLTLIIVSTRRVTNPNQPTLRTTSITADSGNRLTEPRPHMTETSNAARNAARPVTCLPRLGAPWPRSRPVDASTPGVGGEETSREQRAPDERPAISPRAGMLNIRAVE